MENKNSLIKLAESGKIPARIISQSERQSRTDKMGNSIQESRYKQAKSAQSGYSIIVKDNYHHQNPY